MSATHAGTDTTPRATTTDAPPAEAKDAPPTDADAPAKADDTRVIGTPFRKVDGMAKTTGRTKYADDIVLPRMLFCRLKRSPKPHAEIVNIDASAAESMDGVHLVLTGDDFPTPFGILPVSQDEHALCRDKVRFVGDPVAAVVAKDESTAEKACAAIRVEYRDLPTISDPFEAADHNEGDARIHEYGHDGNVHRRIHMEFGDVEQGISEGDRVFEETYFYEGNTHLPMEQHACVADPEPGGKVTLWSSTQTPHYVHRAVAKVLETPAQNVRIIACPNGGGFGGKSDPFNHEIVTAKAALVLGRPVKCSLNRQEVFECHRGRHPVWMRFRTGVRDDGTITGMDLTTALDGGGYGSYGVASTYYTGALATVTYDIPHYRFKGWRAFTNKPPCGPKRGHGTPQPRFGQEIQMDRIAKALDIDPIDLRLRQVLQPDTVTANWLKIGSIGLAECLEAVRDGSGWDERHGRLPHGRGLGVAVGSYICGAGLPIYWNKMPHSGVQLKLDRGGGVTAFCGATDIGQGSDSVLAACVAEVLGLTPEWIRLVVSDADLTPVDLGSYSSRVTLMMGNAAVQAAQRARSLLTKAVAAKWEIPGGNIGFGDGRVFDVENPDHPDRNVEFAQAVVWAEEMHGTLGTVGSYTPPRSPGRYRGAGVGPSPAYSYSACVAEVEVDPDTGIWTVPKIWIGHDIGKPINSVLTMGQVEGSVYMGLGEVWSESSTFRRLPAKRSNALVHKFPSMLEYKTPTFLDMPEVVTYLVEDPDPEGPFGAKEVGQGPLLPVMPAVANAIFDAVGVRVDRCPIHPEMILEGLADLESGGDGRVGPDAMPECEWGDPMRVLTPAQGGDGRSFDQVAEARAKENRR